jgi:hypothetical protein
MRKGKKKTASSTSVNSQVIYQANLEKMVAFAVAIKSGEEIFTELNKCYEFVYPNEHCSKTFTLLLFTNEDVTDHYAERFTTSPFYKKTCSVLFHKRIENKYRPEDFQVEAFSSPTFAGVIVMGV